MRSTPRLPDPAALIPAESRLAPWRRISRGVVALAALVVLAPAPPLSASPSSTQPSFGEWLSGLRREAIERGYRPEVVDLALADVQPLEIITERDRTQAEFTVAFDEYLSRWLNRPFLRLGRQRIGQHRRILGRVSARYGVPAPVIASVWGVESNFGRFAGVRPVIPSLATLAYDPRRAEFFRGELLDAIGILDRGDIDLPRLRGSWAGAMGQPQFMPSSYLKYAVDFDRDGRRDIWGTPADVFASIANYLAEHGWKKGQRWGREVKVPAGDAAAAIDKVPLREEGCRAVRQMTEPRPVREWKRLGLKPSPGGTLPATSTSASLVRAGGRAFLVYPNYEALLAYNCAHHYALGVAMLSERLR